MQWDDFFIGIFIGGVIVSFVHDKWTDTLLKRQAQRFRAKELDAKT